MTRKFLTLLILIGALTAASIARADDPTTDMPTDTPSNTPSSASSPSSASREGDPSPQIEVVDIPTADILEPMTYSTTFRFYSEGGLTGRFLLGPLKRVNLGVSFDAQRVIGGGDPHMVTPAVFFKVKAFDGNDYLPALALGYDNQGMLWQDTTRDYLNKAKDLYVVGSHALFVPNMDVHAGVNVNSFDTGATTFGFFGTTFKLTPNFALLMEYDNIRNGRDNRFNVGGRFWVAPYFNVDFGARNIPHGAERGGERIVRLNYVGHFPF